VIVHDGPTEFVIDFLQGLSRPPQIAARVVLAPQTMSNFITALRENLGRYSQAFGPPPPLPKPSAPRPTVQELYDNFKLTDEQLSGSYANGVMVGHSPAEFLFDFVTGFYPTAAVSSRVFLAAPQVPPALEAFINAFRQFEQRTRRPPDGSPFR
jgi:hypothetical protein